MASAVPRRAVSEFVADKAGEFVGDRAARLDRPDAEGLPRRVVDVDACCLLLALAHDRASRGLSASTR
jgi:hypothetical protein